MTQLFLALAVMGMSGQAKDFSPHSSVTLMTDASVVAPGVPFWAAFQIKLDPHWHTYWKNPGDSGTPTDVRWSLAGANIAPKLEYPVPSALLADDLTIYGYEGQPIFLARITPPKNAKIGQTLRLKAAGAWLICETICVSANEVASISLRVGKTPRPSASKKTIDAAVAALPQKLAGWKFSAAWTSKGISLNVVPPPGVDVSRGRFFCEDPQVVDHSAPPAWSGQTLSIPLSAYANGKPSRLRGLLVAPEGQPWKGSTRAVMVDVPLVMTKNF